jgi:predicted MPP superfamily phosphohydrolase
MIDFLYGDPCVFVIEDQYEILVLTKENGLIGIKIGDRTFYAENSGVLSTEASHAKIRIPQDTLDRARGYTVSFRKSLDRRAYFSLLGDETEVFYPFKPLTKTENIRLYHIADVHYRFALAKQTATYFGDDLDLLVVNGDIGEVETVENYREVAKFVSEISGGSIPTVFVRGNHDTRGRLAERYTDYFPANGKNTYFTFDVGCLHGIVYDCGEDKLDNHAEYGGVNAFEAFRQRETAFFKALVPSDKLTLAIGHICPIPPIEETGSVFDIERERYPQWVAELERVNTALMLCGHIHRAYLLESNMPESLRPHNFPVVLGSACYDDTLWGAAITLNGDTATVCFTDSLHNVRETHEIRLP